MQNIYTKKYVYYIIYTAKTLYIWMLKISNNFLTQNNSVKI